MRASACDRNLLWAAARARCTAGANCLDRGVHARLQDAADVRLLVKPGGKSKGCAYVQFASEAAVAAALQRDQELFHGKHLLVARSKPPRGGGGAAGGSGGGGAKAQQQGAQQGTAPRDDQSSAIEMGAATDRGKTGAAGQAKQGQQKGAKRGPQEREQADSIAAAQASHPHKRIGPSALGMLPRAVAKSASAGKSGTGGAGAPARQGSSAAETMSNSDFRSFLGS